MPVYADPIDGVALAADALTDWTGRVVERMGTPPDIAADVACILVASDRRGIASHGTARLPRYAALIEGGAMDPMARPELLRSKASAALFDARNGWGHHAARIAMDAAIEGAATSGVFMSVVRDSNHYGIAGWYALRAADAGLIGISLTNTSPLVAPTRGVDAMLGTNPIAIAAPAGRRDHLCLDMATSTVPRGRLEVAARRGEALHPAWAIDAEGRPTCSPQDALEGALMPLGGTEEGGGYKGYGLTLLVDVLTGVLGGSTLGPFIAPLFSPARGSSDIGQTFIAIDPDALDEPGRFAARLEQELDLLVAARVAAGAPGRILVPGEPEAAAERRAAERGVIIDRSHFESLLVLAERFEVDLPASMPVGGLASGAR
jgi:LDH2 family malate/lactate/ureidoglycolate dehydrogenase